MQKGFLIQNLALLSVPRALLPQATAAVTREEKRFFEPFLYKKVLLGFSALLTLHASCFRLPEERLIGLLARPQPMQ